MDNVVYKYQMCLLNLSFFCQVNYFKGVKPGVNSHDVKDIPAESHTAG